MSCVRPPLLALAVACIAWLLYAPTLGADFVWDARAKVLGSDFIHNPANLPDVITGRVLTRDVLDNNRPGNLLSLMVDAAIWGKRPAGYHATSVTLHAVICGMLFLLMARLLPAPGGTWPAFFAAVMYAVHPLNVEAVSEVSYREDLLVTASILAALFMAMEFMRRPGIWRNAMLGAGCCAALVYGVSAKENGAAGPLILACYWLLWRRRERVLPWAGLVIAAFAVVFGFVVARFTMVPQHSAVFTERPTQLGGSLGQTLLIQPRIWAMEWTQIIFPHDLCADYGAYSLQNFVEPISAEAVGLIVLVQIFLGFRSRVFAFGSAIFWAGLLPVSNLMPLYRPMADRFLYLPLTGLAMVLARGLYAARRLPGWGRVCVYTAVILCIGGGAAVSFFRERVWHDSLALWQDTAAVNPGSYTAADNLGWALAGAGRNGEAAEAFRRAIRMTRGKEADAWAGLALAEDAEGLRMFSDAAYGQAVSLDVRYGHPEELMKALVIESDVAGKLEVLVKRNTKEALTK